MGSNHLGSIGRRIHLLSLWIVLFVTGLILALATGVGLAATTTNDPATIRSPIRVGGATGNDEKAVDIYPAVAYDSTTQRYLAIWMTLRNAQSSSAGFDVYAGAQVPPGKKSLAYRVTYQSPDHTLTDKEVVKVQKQILDRLEKELGTVLRG